MTEVYAVSIDVRGDHLMLSNGDVVEVFDYLDEDQQQSDPDHADAVVYLDGQGNMRAAYLDDLDTLTVH